MHLIKRLKRKNALIQDCSHNKQAYSYAYIPRSLSVSDNMACLKRKKYQSRDTATTNKSDIHVYIFNGERQCDAFKAEEINERARFVCIPRSLSVSDKERN